MRLPLFYLRRAKQTGLYGGAHHDVSKLITLSKPGSDQLPLSKAPSRILDLQWGVEPNLLDEPTAVEHCQPSYAKPEIP